MVNPPVGCRKSGCDARGIFLRGRACTRQSGHLHPDEIEARYPIDEALTKPVPHFIAVVDDILTTGAHFRASKSVLSARFPAAVVVGLFIARRVPNTSDLEDFDDTGR